MIRDCGLHCWKCGAPLGEEPLPLSRTAECRACRASLHVCRMCLFYDPKVAKSCRETIAEEVLDKTRSNFCGYFQPNPILVSKPAQPVADVRGAAEALFGGTQESTVTPSEARKRLDDLFK